MFTQRDRILPPYTKRVDDTQHRLKRAILFAGLILFAMALGFFIAVLPIQGVFIPITPIVLLFLIALWMAPDVDPQLDKPIIGGYFLFMYVALIWPNYIAFNLPGLPWISMQRLVMFVVVGLGLYALASSSRMRAEVKDVLTSHSLMFRLFVAWVVLQALMELVAGGSTLSRWIHYQIVWNFLFLISAWIHCRPGMPMRLHRAILVGCVVSALVVIPEVIMEKPFWIDDIPAFMGIDPVLLSLIQSSQGRSGDGLYRARSIYAVSVNYAEFIVVFLPFVIHAVVFAKSPIRMIAALLILALLFLVALWTNARTALVGFVIAIPLYAAIWSVRRFKRGAAERDIIGPAAMWAMPVAGLTLMLIVLFVGRIRVRVIGGGQHQASNDGRSEQWDMAIPRIMNNPFGYGVDRAGDIVPYTNSAGIPTIDAYAINLLIDYGILGFLLFISLFFTAIFMGIRSFLAAENDDELIAGPAALSIVGFIFARSILSAEGAQFFAFALAGMILAIYWRQERRAAANMSPQVLVPTPRFPLPPRVLTSTSTP